MVVRHVEDQVSSLKTFNITRGLIVGPSNFTEPEKDALRDFGDQPAIQDIGNKGGVAEDYTAGMFAPDLSKVVSNPVELGVNIRTEALLFVGERR